VHLLHDASQREGPRLFEDLHLRRLKVSITGGLVNGQQPSRSHKHLNSASLSCILNIFLILHVSLRISRQAIMLL
jgi:hypothetical protein